MQKFDNEFPKEVLDQVKTAERIKPVFLSKRSDFRVKAVFTFAPTEDEPVDRAFSLSKNGTGWRLGIHVADVAEFACPGSPLDREARRRGGDFETPSGKIYMLPPSVTDNICNLKTNTDRLAVSALLDIDKNGRLVSANFEESIVRVAVRCVYSETDALLSNSDPSSMMALREKYAQLMPVLNDMYELAGILYRDRIERGALAFTPYKRMFTRDEKGRICSVHYGLVHDTEQMLKEIVYFSCCSLGKYMADNGLPCLFLGRESIKDSDVDEICKIAGIDTPPIDLSSPMRATMVSEETKGERIHSYICEAFELLLPPKTFSDKPVGNAYCACDTIATFTNPTGKYADLLTQFVIKEAIAASGRTENINMKKLTKITKERAKAATEAAKYEYLCKKEIRGACSLEIMNAAGKSPVTGIPVTVAADGSVMVILNNGVFARTFKKVSGYKKNDSEFVIDSVKRKLLQEYKFIIKTPSAVQGESTVDFAE